MQNILLKDSVIAIDNNVGILVLDKIWLFEFFFSIQERL